MKIRCGVVGVGEMGSAHARNYLASPNAELYAACDIDKRKLEAFAAKFPVQKLYSSVAEMARDSQLQASSVTVPNRWHAECAIGLLKAGKSVLVEKPMAASAAEAREMAATAEQSGAVLQTGFMWRFHNDVRFVQKAIAEGKIGKPFFVRYCAVTVGPPGGQTGARVSGDSDLWYLRKSVAMGGIILDMGVHGIDTTRCLLGSPATKSVFARIGTHFEAYWGSKDPVEDVALLVLEFEGGIHATIECAWAPRPTNPLPEGACVVVGPKGYASLFPTRVQYQAPSGDAWRCETPIPSEPNDSLFMYQRQVDHFVECVQQRSRPVNHPLESLESVRISDAAYESARTGAVVRL